VNIGTWNDTKVWSCIVTYIALDETYSRNQDILILCGRIPFKRTLPGYNLEKGVGTRQIQQHVHFPKKFYSTPQILTSFCLVDFLIDQDIRAKIAPSYTNETGADVILSTWNGSHVWSSSVAWMAIGIPYDYYHTPTSASPAIVVSGAPITAPIHTTPAIATPIIAYPAITPPITSTYTTTAVPHVTTPIISAIPVASTSSGSSEKDDDEALCKICYDQKFNTVLIPCGHMCLCTACSKLVSGPGKKNECPICKQKIKSIVQTFQA